LQCFGGDIVPPWTTWEHEAISRIMRLITGQGESNALEAGIPQPSEACRRIRFHSIARSPHLPSKLGQLADRAGIGLHNLPGCHPFLDVPYEALDAAIHQEHPHHMDLGVSAAHRLPTLTSSLASMKQKSEEGMELELGDELRSVKLGITHDVVEAAILHAVQVYGMDTVFTIVTTSPGPTALLLEQNRNPLKMDGREFRY
jgi:hypothetical protein